MTIEISFKDYFTLHTQFHASTEILSASGTASRFIFSPLKPALLPTREEILSLTAKPKSNIK